MKLQNNLLKSTILILVLFAFLSISAVGEEKKVELTKNEKAYLEKVMKVWVKLGKWVRVKESEGRC